jgi:orotidine-5'-phosphate decarboxylase
MYFRRMTREQLFEQVKKKQSYLCIGLDTDIRKIPVHLHQYEDPVFEFNRMIIEATHEYCIAYKPNLAFYECNGPSGLISLEKTCSVIPEELFTIADAKRGDIGNTTEMYARTFFEYYNFDSITIAPYMGKDSVLPFFDYKNKWVILLALTSNAGSMDFQLTEVCAPGSVKEKKLYQHVIEHAQSWGNPNQLMFVVGATHPELFHEIRKMANENFFLVPGVGAQGGNLEEISKAGMNSMCGLIVNSSRQIIYASSGKDFAEKAALEAKKIQQKMKQLLETLI